MRIPAAIDVIQENEKITTPEIRVWLHHKDGGDDDYVVFDSFKEAEEFIKDNEDEAEDHPLVAYNGFEFDIYGIEELQDSL